MMAPLGGGDKTCGPGEDSDFSPLHVVPPPEGQSSSKIWNETHTWYLDINAHFWKFSMEIIHCIIILLLN